MKNEIVIYQPKEISTRIDVRIEDETVWLNKEQMSLLFGRDKSVISRHISNIFKEGELEKESTIKDYLTVRTEGNRKIKKGLERLNA